jgi:peptide/nickel transport system permease protein
VDQLDQKEEQLIVETPPQEDSTKPADDEEIFLASQWKLMWWKFRKHKLALISVFVIALIYTLGIFAEFFSPYNLHERHAKFAYATPMRIRIFHEGKLRRPFVYGITQKIDMETLRKTYVNDKTKVYPIRFFVRGEEYRMWGRFEGDLHLFGVDEGGMILLFGANQVGRDMFTRILHGSRISLSIGFIGVIISFLLGITLGGISGYAGGIVDTLIQRIIEILRSIPTLPLWMALGASVPMNWPPLRVYLFITIILSIIGWTGMARVVRGKLLSLREEDFVMAARLAGTNEIRIIRRHLLPSFMSHLIVSITIAVPSMILGETSLSFLGLGLRPPITSWGVLLQEAQNVRTVALHPWLLLPVFFVIATVLAFNFMGDGLRDAADPYVS